MAKDRVRPLKIESPSSGGTETDEEPNSANPNEDYPDVRGVVFQYGEQDEEGNEVEGTYTDDELVYIERDVNGNLIFEDENVGPYTLTVLAESASGGITAAEHPALRQLIHFIDDGPAEGFASGAHKEILPAGDPFPTSIIWWESTAKLQKIVEKIITRTGTGSLIAPNPIVWTMYDTDGVSTLASVSDEITYSGPFELTRTRTLSASG